MRQRLTRAWFGVICVSGTLAIGALCGVRTLAAQQTVAATHNASDDTHITQELLASRVTITLAHVTRAAAIDSISQVAKVFIQYYSETLDAHPGIISIRATQQPLGSVLEQVLEGTGLRVTAEGPKKLLVIPTDAMAHNDSIPGHGAITGRVTDSATGRGLSGVTIKVAGTKISAMTQDSGRFTLSNVGSGDQMLIARLFGYRPANHAVTVSSNQSVTARIQLVSVPTVLSGVVTTATGTQRKLEVGNDITTLNVDSIRQTAPITSVTDLLESRVPGLTVLHSSGTPGDPARLRLRGPSSITGNNDPIVIVDGVRVYAAQSDTRNSNLAGSGVAAQSLLTQGTSPNYAAPSPVDQIDPNSIETIEVLKGPSASSLYGSDAANGVIVITTKRGRTGATTWNATAGEGLSYLPGKYPNQVVRWAHGVNDIGTRFLNPAFGYPTVPCGIEQPVCSVIDSVISIQQLNSPRWSPLGHGDNTNGSVTISGGSGTLLYGVTGSATSTIGYLRLPDVFADAFQDVHGYSAPGWAKRPDRYTTWGESGQLTAQPSPTLQVTLQSNLFHGFQQRSSLDQVAPAISWIIDTLDANYYKGEEYFINAYERASDEQLTFRNALTTAWSPWTWLPLTGVAGLDVTTGHDISLLARDIVTERISPDTLGRYGVGQKNATAKTLNVNTTIPGWRGRLRTALGFNIYSQNTTDLSTAQDTLPIGVTTPLTLNAISQQSVTGTTTYGWFFEPRLTLSERFFLTPGFRLDGGNANGGNAGVSGLPAKLSFAALFPKLNFSYVALNRQDETSPAFLGVFTLLRPRLAFGSAGVQPSPGDQLRLLGPVANGSSDTLIVTSFGNTHLRPERSSEVEGGIDAELWHNRASVQLTHARKIQHDAIISVPVAISVYGGGSINLNIGEIQSTNTELTASITPIQTGMMSWTIGGNFSHNDNKVLSVDARSASLVQTGSTSDTRVAVGYPLFGRWSRPIIGYGDANGDGIIERSEIRLGDTSVYLGRQDPAYTAALTTDLSMFHGRLGLHANIAHEGEFSQINGGSYYPTTMLSTANEPGATLGQQAVYVAATGNTLDLNHSIVGLVQTVSFWRFQSLSVNYNVPPSLARHFRAHNMSVALQGSNLGLWSNYRGKDPNVNAFPNGNMIGDGGQFPQARTWSLQFTLGS